LGSLKMRVRELGSFKMRFKERGLPEINTDQLSPHQVSGVQVESPSSVGLTPPARYTPSLKHCQNSGNVGWWFL
jgi:hypothetical protein